MSEVSKITFKDRIFNLPKASVVITYLVTVLSLGSLWLSRGDYLGSMSGGLCFGLLFGFWAFMEPKNKWVKSEFVTSITSVLVLMMMAFLAYWKDNTLMPSNWEPQRAQDAVGMLGFFLAIGIQGTFEWARTPQEEIDRIDAAEKEKSTKAIEGESSKKHDAAPKWLIAVAASLLAINILTIISLSFPQWLSTPSVAVSRYIASDIYAFKYKSGLAYHLAGNTHVNIASIEIQDSEIKALLHVKTEVAPFLNNGKQANSHEALKQYFNIDQKDRMVVEIDGEVKFEPSGISGWKVNHSDFDLDPVVLANKYNNGSLKVVKNQPYSEFSLNMFGMFDFILMPFNAISLLTLLFAIPALIIRTRNLVVFGIVNGIISFVILTAPLYLFPLT